METSKIWNDKYIFEDVLKKYSGIIKTNHNAVKIVDKDIDTRLYKIQYYNNGKKKHIKCKYIFVCGGPIMTPEFLFNSGIKKNIGNSLKFHQMSRLVAESENEINENDFGVPVRQVNHFKPETDLWLLSKHKTTSCIMDVWE